MPVLSNDINSKLYTGSKTTSLKPEMILFWVLDVERR
jgi:hypothetical protein